IGTFTVYYNTTPVGNSCPAEDSLTITITPQNTILPNTQSPICLGDTLNLSATASGAGIITWYSDIAGTNIIGTGSIFIDIPSTTGTYTYYVNEAGQCPSEMDSIVVIIQEVTAIINATPITGQTPLNVFFGNGSSSGIGISYNWDFGTEDTSNLYTPSYTYNDEGIYTIILIVTDGLCFASDTITIETLNQSSILIPNIFTPNGDGLNDIFTVKGVNLKSVNGEIYNRWGQLMFSWKHLKGYWNGRTLAGAEAPDGTYFYIINAEGFDGEVYLKKSGFSLIR
ncbi:MAG: gliding motility-associated C-terminal domain-containing protein, partial [Flavobacteriales bacterium]|nr:gliding motility-associated C-terminal domain-containing protein [Flavobacteriales bacterium]